MKLYKKDPAAEDMCSGYRTQRDQAMKIPADECHSAGRAMQAGGGIGSLMITALHTTSLTIWQDMPMGTITQHPLRVTTCFLIGFEARSIGGLHICPGRCLAWD